MKFFVYFVIFYIQIVFCHIFETSDLLPHRKVYQLLQRRALAQCLDRKSVV